MGRAWTRRPELDIGQKAMLGGHGGSFCAVREPRFGENRGNVPRYRRPADLQFLSDDGIRRALCDQPQYLEFSGAEVGKVPSVH